MELMNFYLNLFAKHNSQKVLNLDIISRLFVWQLDVF